MAMSRNRIGRTWFPYVVVTAIAASAIATIAAMTGLHVWEAVIWTTGACLFLGMLIFTFVEVRRLAGISKSNAQRELEENEADRDACHIVIVGDPTGEPYPHHEDHEGSAGLDQGQLTSRLPDWTPLVRNRERPRK